MTAITKSWTTIADSVIDPDSPITTALMTGLRDNGTHLREWLGASFTAGAEQDHNHDGINSALVQVGPNLLRNGSFESAESGWTFTDYTGGSHTTETSNDMHGATSMSIASTSTTNGGGDGVQNEYMAVGENGVLDVEFWVKASAANVSARVQVIWYNDAQSQISATTVYDTTSAPTTATRIGSGAKAPSTARFAKIKIIGGVPGAGSATGTIYFDGIHVTLARSIVMLDDLSGSAVSSLDFTHGITADFDVYMLEIIEVVISTTNQSLGLRVSEDGGATWKSGATDYDYAQTWSAAGTTGAGISNSSTLFPLTRGGSMHNTSALGYSGRVVFYNPAGSVRQKGIHWIGLYQDSAAGPSWATITGMGKYGLTTNPINGIRLFTSSGTMTGRARLYGIRGLSS